MLVGCMVLLHFSSLGQEFGVKVALNTMGLKGAERGSVRLLPQLGWVARLGDLDGLHFSSEYLLTLKGAGIKTNESKRNISTFYNEIALMLCYTIHQDFTVKVGFQPGVLLLGHMKESLNGEVSRRGITGQLTRFDYSTLVGAEYRYSEKIVLGFRYDHSFVPMAQYNNPLFDNENLYLWRGVKLYAVYDLFDE